MSEFFRVENVSLASVYIVPIPSLKVAAAVKRLMSLVNVFFTEWEHDEGLREMSRHSRRRHRPAGLQTVRVYIIKSSSIIIILLFCKPSSIKRRT